MEKKSSGLSIASLVLGIVGFMTGFIGIGIIFDILAIIFGIISAFNKEKKHGCGVAGLVIGLTGIVLTAFIANVFSNDNGGTISSDPKATTVSTKDNTSGDLSDNDFTVEEYNYQNTIGDSIYIVSVTNNSDECVDISADATALDSFGNSLSVLSGNIYSLEPGKTYPMEFYYDSTDAYDYQYTMNYSTASRKSRLSDLSFSETQNDDNVIISCKNNSSSDVDFPQGFVIFFNQGTVVGATYNYLNGDDMTLKAGNSKSQQFDCCYDFDSYKAYYIAK